jgi:hypothetical protein
MRKSSALALLTAGTALSLSLAAAPAAFAATAPAPAPASHGGPGGGGNGGGGGGTGRPGGPPVQASGTGSLGTGWTLKSMHDDAPGVGQVVGEEFEIDAPPGQTWIVTFDDNGVIFLDHAPEVTVAGGVTINAMTANQAGTQVMHATAVSTTTGETIDASVSLPALAGGGGTDG